MNTIMKRTILALALATGFTFTAAAQPIDLKSQLASAKSANDSEAVAEIYRRLHSAKPKETDTLKGLIRAELNVGNQDAVRALLAKLEQAVSADDPALLEAQGDLFLRDDKKSDATRCWQAALKGDPNNAQLLSKLALHFLHQEKNAATAAVYFKRLLNLRNRAQDHIEIGKVAIAMRDWTVLVEQLAALKTNFSMESAAKTMIPAFERITTEMTRIAELDAQEQTEADPTKVILKRGRLFLDAGFSELALNDARRALKLKPHALHVRLHYAAAAARLWEDTEKIRAWGIEPYQYRRGAPVVSFLNQLAEYDDVLFDDPDNISVLSNRAQLLYQYTQRDLAATDARRLLELSPDHVQALRLLALVSETNGYFGKATQFIDKASGLAPDDVSVLAAASSIHSRQGNFEKVIQLCDHWISLGGDHTARERRQTAMENLQKN